MRNFLTWCIATFLFGLCLLENEARKSAQLLQNENKKYMQSNLVDSQIAVNRNILVNSGYHSDNQTASAEKFNKSYSGQFANGDSLSLQMELGKQKNKLL